MVVGLNFVSLIYVFVGRLFCWWFLVVVEVVLLRGMYSNWYSNLVKFLEYC